MGEIIRGRLAGGEDLALDVGCGLKRAEPGAIGMDWAAESGAEVVWDVNRRPWPLPDDSFARVDLSHIIEHLDDIVAGMREVHRVARRGARVFLVTPHFSSHNSIPIRLTVTTWRQPASSTLRGGHSPPSWLPEAASNWLRWS